MPRPKPEEPWHTIGVRITKTSYRDLESRCKKPGDFSALVRKIIDAWRKKNVRR